MLKFFYPISRFFSAGETFVGKGSINALRALNATRALVIVSPSVKQNFTETIEKSVGSHEVLLQECPKGEPSYERSKGLIEAALEFEPDWIVAIGGGSVIDMAKFVRIVYEHPTIDFVKLERPNSCPSLDGKSKMVAVPTTFGTGSEVSSTTVISLNEKKKSFVFSYELMPNIAILDPELTVTVPRTVLAESILDALTHAFEGYISTTSNPMCDIMAEKAIDVIFSSAKKGLDSADRLESCTDLMIAAMMAGWVQNIKVPGLAHAIGHQLGNHHIPHGKAVGAMLPHVLAYNSKDEGVNSKLANLAQKLNKRDSIHELKNFMASLDVEINAHDVFRVVKGADSFDLDLFSEGAAQDICARMNPVKVSKTQIKDFVSGFL